MDNTEDIIDSSDVIARIAELTESDDQTPTDISNDPDWTANELPALVLLAKEGESLSDWEYGAALIRDSYFETYARELADDIGAVDSKAGWPNSFIDWEAAADALKMDYTEIDFGGVTYWGRV